MADTNVPPRPGVPSERMRWLSRGGGRRFRAWPGARALVCLITCSAASVGCGPASDAGGELPTLEPELLHAFPDSVVLTSILGADSDSTGVLYFAQGLSGAVHAAGPSGELFDSIGGAGDGPGELRQARFVTHLGGLLWVGDWRANRLEVFDRRGDAVRSIRRHAAPRYVGEEPLGPVAPLSNTTVLLAPMGRRTLPGRRRGGLDLYRLDLATDSTALMVSLPIPPEDEYSVEFSDGQRIVGSSPFPQAALWARADDGILVTLRHAGCCSDVGHYRLLKVGFAGDTIYDVEVPAEPPTPSESELLEYFGPHLDRLPSDAPRAILEAVALPPTYPPTTRLRATSSGTVFVRLHESPDAVDVRWDVFSPDGELLGRMVTRPDFELWEFDGSTAWATTERETGVRVLGTYRLCERAQVEAPDQPCRPFRPS